MTRPAHARQVEAAYRAGLAMADCYAALFQLLHATGDELQDELQLGRSLVAWLEAAGLDVFPAPPGSSSLVSFARGAAPAPDAWPFLAVDEVVRAILDRAAAPLRCALAAPLTPPLPSLGR